MIIPQIMPDEVISSLGELFAIHSSRIRLLDWFLCGRAEDLRCGSIKIGDVGSSSMYR